MNKRIEYLDLTKILAMFLVSYYHITYYNLDYGFVDGMRYIPNVNRVTMNICAMSVPLFFMVTGTILINKSYTNKKIIYKILNIIILMLFWSILVEYPSWFLKTLAILYFIYPIVKYLYDNNMKIYYSIMILVLIMPFIYNFMIVIGIQFGVDSLSRLNRTGFFTLYSILYFMLGGILFNKELDVIRCITIFIIGLILTTYEGYIITNYNNTMFDNVNSSFPTIGAMLMAIGVYLLIKKIKIKNETILRIIRVVGENCLIVYIFHLYVWKRSNYILNAQAISIFQGILYTLGIDIICILIGIIISKVPFARRTIKL